MQKSIDALHCAHSEVSHSPTSPKTKLIPLLNKKIEENQHIYSIDNI